MAKPNSLTEGMRVTTPAAAAPGNVRNVSRIPVPPPSRGGRVLIGAFFAPEVRKALKAIALEEDRTMHGVIAEAFDNLFASRHRPQIAALSAASNRWGKLGEDNEEGVQRG
jgi:hypothetical protein